MSTNLTNRAPAVTPGAAGAASEWPSPDSSAASVQQQPARPLAYFLTWHTYGTHLHGDPGESVDREHNKLGEPKIHENPGLNGYELRVMTQEAFVLDNAQRTTVDGVIREVAAFRGWIIHALAVRTTHVHIVVTGEDTPDKMLGDFKRWSTKRLREAGLVTQERNVWQRHGSTPWLWDRARLDGAIDYVLNRQDLPGGGYHPPKAAWERACGNGGGN